MTRYQRRKLLAAGILQPTIRSLPPLPELTHDGRMGGRPRAPFVSDKVERRRKQWRDYFRRRRMSA